MKLTKMQWISSVCLLSMALKLIMLNIDVLMKRNFKASVISAMKQKPEFIYTFHNCGLSVNECLYSQDVVMAIRFLHSPLWTSSIPMQFFLNFSECSFLPLLLA